MTAMSAYDAPTLPDFEDLVRQMVNDENRLLAAIGIEAVQRRRRKLIARMHHAVDRVALQCRTDAEKAVASLSGGGNVFKPWTCPECGTAVPEPAIHHLTGEPYCLLCAIGTEAAL